MKTYNRFDVLGIAELGFLVGVICDALAVHYLTPELVLVVRVGFVIGALIRVARNIIQSNKQDSEFRKRQRMVSIEGNTDDRYQLRYFPVCDEWEVIDSIHGLLAWRAVSENEARQHCERLNTAWEQTVRMA